MAPPLLAAPQAAAPVAQAAAPQAAVPVAQAAAPVAVIRDLGFVMDDHLSMASQLSNICRSAYYHISRIAKIRHSLTISVCKSLIHGLVTSRLDYGNAMLFGIADRLLHRLEMVQRSAARVVMQIRRGDRQSYGVFDWASSVTHVLTEWTCLTILYSTGTGNEAT